MKSEEAVARELEKERMAREGGEEPPGMRFMIAGDAPIVMEKACECFVKEMATRSWRHTEKAKRRTLQRQDVLTGVGESEMFDFLIDIVPRIMPPAPAPETGVPSPHPSSAAAAIAKVETAAPPGQHLVEHQLLPTEQQHAMNLPDTETRYAQFQEMHSQMSEHYDIMQQQAEGSLPGGIAHDVVVDEQSQQPQVVLNPQLMIHPPQGSTMPQWHPGPPSTTDGASSEGEA